jgi:hypothetical protein
MLKEGIFEEISVPFSEALPNTSPSQLPDTVEQPSLLMPVSPFSVEEGVNGSDDELSLLLLQDDKGTWNNEPGNAKEVAADGAADPLVQWGAPGSTGLGLSDSLNSPQAAAADVESGILTVGDEGKVVVEFLADGGAYESQVAVFSLAGMEGLIPGSSDFIQEAARRALSNSAEGYVVIDDSVEGASLSGRLGERDRNAGEVVGAKRFAFPTGTELAVMLVPNGSVQDVFDNPTAEGSLRPLFSIAEANPDGRVHIAEIRPGVYAMEDIRADMGSDFDYNDIVFSILGATANVASINSIEGDQNSWLNTALGQELTQLPDEDTPSTPSTPDDSSDDPADGGSEGTDDTPDVPVDSGADEPDDTPDTPVDSGADEPDNTPDTPVDSGADEPDDTPDTPVDSGADEPDDTPDEPVDSGSDEPDDTPDEPVDSGADEPDDTPDEPVDSGSDEPDDTPDEPVDSGSDEPDDTPDTPVDSGSDEPDDTPDTPVDSGSDEPDDTPDTPVDSGSDEPDDTPDTPVDSGSDEPDDTPDTPVDSGSDEPDDTPDTPVDSGSDEPDDTPDEPVDSGNDTPDEPVDSGNDTPSNPVADKVSIADSVAKFKPGDSEAKIAATGAASITIGTQTIYIGTNQVSSINQNPIIASFDSANPNNNWVATNYERTGADGRGRGLAFINGELYGVFTVDGTQGSPSEDFRRAARDAEQSWLRSYGAGGGPKVSVLGRIDPKTGELLDAAYLSAVLSSGKSNSLIVDNITSNSDGNLVVTARSFFSPRQPDGSPLTRTSSTGSSPFVYTAVITPELDRVISTAAEGWA